MPTQKWWLEKHGHWYNQLPHYYAGMVVRCPTKNRDGSDIAADDVHGCGSDEILWNPGDVYDCLNCGIFFSDYAADPPHRRPLNPEIDSMTENEFHAKRRMFAVRDGTVLVAPPNYPYSHFEWLLSIFPEPAANGLAKQVLNTCTRGYVLNKHIRVYRGEDFSHRVQHAAVTAAIAVMLPLTVGGIEEIGFGVRAGDGQPWEPRSSYPLESYLARVATQSEEGADVVSAS